MDSSFLTQKIWVKFQWCHSIIPVILSDHNYSKPHHFLHFVSTYISSWRLQTDTSKLVDVLISRNHGWQITPEGGMVISQYPFNFFGASMISLERLMLESSSFTNRYRLYEVLAQGWQTTPEICAVRATCAWPILNWGRYHISGMVGAIEWTNLVHY